ncbi:MAG TPA: diguanylate cyclase, partial [Longimicrobiales bacterium]|nr:diguanylate cyclase [Longimicrobiales bacterium]
REPAFRAECIALGADEFLEKPVEPEFFSAIVSARLGRAAALTRLAQEDHLTGLPNRAAFARIYRQLQAISERGDEALTLAVVDVDNLKVVNDRRGHSAGDRVLEGLAESARKTLRDSDVLARWGGDEFVILLPNTGVDGAVEAVEKARSAFHDWIAVSGPGEELGLSFSAGVTAVGADDALDGAVARADRLLYQAKKVGGDRIVGEGGLEGVPTPTVLLVEDEESVAGLLGRMLEMEGFVVRRAADGEEALDAVLGSPPDLVVLDIMLPGRDGFEVLREMRSHEELQDLPVLILTALSEEDSVVKGFRLGVDEYLSKPVSREDFLARVRALARVP